MDAMDGIFAAHHAKLAHRFGPDAAQQALIKYWEWTGQHAAPEHTYAWLAQVARNYLRNEYRSPYHRVNVLVDVDPIQPDSVTPERRAECRELLERAPAILVQHAMGGGEEPALTSTARVQRFRARQQFRASLSHSQHPSETVFGVGGGGKK